MVIETSRPIPGAGGEYKINTRHAGRKDTARFIGLR